MNDRLLPLRRAVHQGQRLLMLVCLFTLVLGAALLTSVTTALCYFIGLVTATTGVVFLVVWFQDNNPESHPLVCTVRDEPQRVRWVLRKISSRRFGGAEQAVLHIGLDDGETFDLPVSDLALSLAAEACIMAACPDAARLSAALLPTARAA